MCDGNNYNVLIYSAYLQLLHGTRVVLFFGDDEGEPERADDAENGSLVPDPQVLELLVSLQDPPDPLQHNLGAGGREVLRRLFPEGNHQELANVVVVHVHGFQRSLDENKKNLYV